MKLPLGIEGSRFTDVSIVTLESPFIIQDWKIFN